jgi:hypothetical protein
VLYAYLGAALGYFLNSFTLLYIALFSLSLAAMVLAIGGLKLTDLETRFDVEIPRWPVIAFLMLMAVMLGAREILDNIGFIRSGIIPSGMQRSGGTNYFVYTFDLGLIVPLLVLSSIWLWRRSPVGLVSSGMVLIKSAVMVCWDCGRSLPLVVWDCRFGSFVIAAIEWPRGHRFISPFNAH